MTNKIKITHYTVHFWAPREDIRSCRCANTNFACLVTQFSSYWWLSNILWRCYNVMITLLLLSFKLFKVTHFKGKQS